MNEFLWKSVRTMKITLEKRMTNLIAVTSLELMKLIGLIWNVFYRNSSRFMCDVQRQSSFNVWYLKAKKHRESKPSSYEFSKNNLKTTLLCSCGFCPSVNSNIRRWSQRKRRNNNKTTSTLLKGLDANKNSHLAERRNQFSTKSKTDHKA